MKTATIVLSFATLFFTMSAEAQWNQKRRYNEINNWDTREISVSYGVAYGEHKEGDQSTSHVVRVTAENLPIKSLIGGTGLMDVTAGYHPSGFVRLRYVISPFHKNSTGRIAVMLPLVDIRPGMNQLRHKVTENLSFSTGAGLGYMNSGKLGKNGSSTWRAGAGVKYLLVSEAISPGLYSYEGQQLNGRRSIDTINAHGFGAEARAQFSLINKILLGFEAQGAQLKQRNYNGDEETEYYDAQGMMYARVRVLKAGKIILDVDANWYLRFTNLNDFRVGETRSFPGVGARLGWFK